MTYYYKGREFSARPLPVGTKVSYSQKTFDSVNNGEGTIIEVNPRYPTMEPMYDILTTNRYVISRCVAPECRVHKLPTRRKNNV